MQRDITLRLTLIGPPQVHWQGELLQLPTGKALPLLAYLALSVHPVPRQELSRTLWGTGKGASLRVLLSKFRKLPGWQQWLSLAENGEISLKAHTDIDRLRLLMQEEAYGEVVKQWQNLGRTPQLLVGVNQRKISQSFYEWLQLEQESIDSLFRQALRAHAMQLEQQGNLTAALACTHDLLTLDSFNETAHRTVMRLEAQRGNIVTALHQYERCRNILARELATQPVEATEQLAQTLRATLAETSRSAVRPGNLHHFLERETAFIGRKKELHDLGDLLSKPACRLLTLLGVGGIGKTRLALEAALQQDEHFLHGVYFVSLTAVSDTSLLPAAIASAVGLIFSGANQPKTQLLSYLSDKSLLLVLDNAEHLARDLSLVSDILIASPGSKLLITSRERLNLKREWLFEVRGFRYPYDNDMNDLASYDAVKHFLASARRSKSSFKLNKVNKPHIKRLTQVLKGYPLATEIAAGWVAALSCKNIVAEVERGNLDILHSPLKDVPERHRSIRAVLESSWRMLRADEQASFARLSVFRDEVPQQAALAVTGVPLHQLLALANKSLIFQTRPDCFSMHELPRSFAAEKLSASEGGVAVARNLHRKAAAFYADQAVTVRHSIKDLTPQLQAFDHLVLAEAYEEACGLLNSIGFNYLLLWGQADMVINLYERVIHHLAVSELKARALNSMGLACNRTGKPDEAIGYFQKAIAISRATNDRQSETNFLGNLGLAYNLAGELRQAISCHREALAISRELGDRRGEGIDLGCLGLAYNRLGEVDRAISCHEQALAISREVGDQRSEGNHLGNLAHIYSHQDKPQTVLAYTQQALRLRRKLGDKRGEAIDLSSLANIYNQLGQTDKALEHYNQALELNRSSGERIGTADNLFTLANLHHQLGASSDALAHYQEALKLSRDIGDPHMEANMLGKLGHVYCEQNDLVTAAALWLTALDMLPERSSHLAERLEQQFADLRLQDTAVATLHHDGDAILLKVTGQAYRFPHEMLLMLTDDKNVIKAS